VSRVARALRTGWRVLRGEGLRAAVDRARDRLHDRRERRRADVAAPGELGRAPVLNVLSLPPSPRLGGVPTQLRNRLAFERRDRPCALLHPHGAGWRLERRHRSDSRALALYGASFEDALRRAMSETGATVVHAEGVAGVPVEALVAVRRDGRRLVVSIHDFAAFCRRPHLIERPADRFCGYCRDLDRCHACLRHDFDVDDGFQARYRQRGAELLRAADAVVYPSRFLRETHARLFPGLDPARQHVIEPGTPPVDDPHGRGRPAVQAAGVVRHVAWVGAVQVHKGALVFEQVARQLQAEGLPLRWTALGGGDAELLARFRALPRVAVRGYWRAGALPIVLRRLGVDLALLLSTWPEAYGLTLDECWRAGVPVVAFDHGAMADRIRELGGGLLVPPAEGAAGVARAIRQAVAGPLPSAPLAQLLPDPRQAAAAHLELYRALGVTSAGSA
jgi:glycosyltransferase involved in cell wall biosynthesis